MRVNDLRGTVPPGVLWSEITLGQVVNVVGQRGSTYMKTEAEKAVVLETGFQLDKEAMLPYRYAVLQAELVIKATSP